MIESYRLAPQRERFGTFSRDLCIRFDLENRKQGLLVKLLG